MNYTNYFEAILSGLEAENKKEQEKLQNKKNQFFTNHSARMDQFNAIINELDMTQERTEQLHKRNMDSLSKLNEMLDTL